MNNKLKITLSGIMASTLLLGAGVFASYRLQDNAPKIGVRIGLAALETVDVVFKDASGGTFYSEEVLVGGKLLNMPESDPTLYGYTFDGWSTSNSTYDKTTDNFDTKTFTTNVTYYPRFASYGYSKNSGNATHLPNKWDINNNISFAQNDVIHVGTYIYGKTSLENESASTVTIPRNGDYAVVCGADSSDWDVSKAPTLSNWHIEKYYTLDITNNWSDYPLFAHFFVNDSVKDTRMMTNNVVSGNKRFVYAPYNMTKVIFGAIWENSTHKDYVEDNWGNVKYQLPEITLDATTNYELIDREFVINYGTPGGKSVFIAGNFHKNFTVAEQYQLTSGSGNDWSGTYSFIKGTEASFKFVIADTKYGTNANTWETDPNRTETFNSTGSTRYYWR